MKLPPRPWSARMQAQSEVFSAFMEAEVNLSEKLDLTVPGSTEERQAMNALRAARLQSNAANEQMWIIHTEEEADRASAH